MSKTKTEQEQFWAGEFGDDYISRNQQALLPEKVILFSKIISRTHGVKSVIEFGSNIGLNLRAIKQILPAADLSAIEIDAKAARQVKESLPEATVYHQSLLDFKPDRKRDFVFTKGVLIHLSPDRLVDTYDILYQTTKRYLCVVEYYNPTPVEVPYRGHAGKLFKRDFAGELLDRFKDLELLDYGFVYRRDENCPMDDVNWFLLEKR